LFIILNYSFRNKKETIGIKKVHQREGEKEIKFFAPTMKISKYGNAVLGTSPISKYGKQVFFFK
jgi:hypothetical protein